MDDNPSVTQADDLNEGGAGPALNMDKFLQLFEIQRALLQFRDLPPSPSQLPTLDDDSPDLQYYHSSIQKEQSIEDLYEMSDRIRASLTGNGNKNMN